MSHALRYGHLARFSSPEVPVGGEAVVGRELPLGATCPDEGDSEDKVADEKRRIGHVLEYRRKRWDAHCSPRVGRSAATGTSVRASDLDVSFRVLLTLLSFTRKPTRDALRLLVSIDKKHGRHGLHAELERRVDRVEEVGHGCFFRCREEDSLNRDK